MTPQSSEGSTIILVRRTSVRAQSSTYDEDREPIYSERVHVVLRQARTRCHRVNGTIWIRLHWRTTTTGIQWSQISVHNLARAGRSFIEKMDSETDDDKEVNTYKLVLTVDGEDKKTGSQWLTLRV